MKKKTKNSETESPFIEGLKVIAKRNVEDNETLLINWWCKKYNLPPNHPLLLERYEEDLLLEVLQDNLIREKEQPKTKEDVSEQEYEELLTEEHEARIKRRLAFYNKNKGEKLSKWQRKAKLIEGEIGTDIEDDEFEDEF